MENYLENYKMALSSAHENLDEINKKRDYYKEKLEKIEEDDKQEDQLFLSYVILAGIADDVEEVLNLLSKESKPRYQNFIIRNITEHVIEYMYLMEHKELIPEYFGSEAELDVEESADMNNISKAYKNFGQNRYASKRASVNSMAKAIGEKYATDGVPGLYDVFSIISENCHNSYLYAVIDEMSESETQNKMFNLGLMLLVLKKLLEFEKGN